MTELVVLAGPDGLPAGTADKAAVHTTDTPLHFAFSAWVIAGSKVLVTRRALAKQTWPGVWTNSFCGHPAPGEDNVSAVLRRAHFELGIHAEADQVREVLPDFSYRAVDSSGIVEHEICPVFVVELPEDVQLHPNPDEVDSIAWAAPAALIDAAVATPFAFSPWMVEEITEAPLREAISVL
ncbi:MAG: isopentenyl-diphosphate Delta-isomerase [Corynebacterium striatum]|nr:isopentenyl-diphosphate Delta-isomerase [Corynebacterium striatum]